MLSCTLADATPRLLFDAPAPAAPSAYPRFAREREREQTQAGGCRSAAGLQRRPWLARLRRALAEDLFVVHYQPIVSLREGRVSHHEALVRLADEGAGRLVAPARFLPAAERYGLIREIDRAVLAKVLGLMSDLEAGGVSVAVNLSALSVTDADMLDHIEAALAVHGVAPGRLVIEVTETASISDMGRAKSFCAGVQELGCAVALDDFGTGFGSLHYLKHLPFRYLKIDGDFIRALPASPNDQLVVQALVGLASGMGASTIAEFVEDEPTIALLRELGVDYVQGFGVGRPQPALALAA